MGTTGANSVQELTFNETFLCHLYHTNITSKFESATIGAFRAERLSAFSFLS